MVVPSAAAESGLLIIKERLENVAILMHCNLRAPDAAPFLIRFKYDIHAKFQVAQPIRCRLIAFLQRVRLARIAELRITRNAERCTS